MNHNTNQKRDSRGRKLPATHCWRGHEFTPENLYFNPRADGRIARYCRLCRAISDKEVGPVRRKSKRQLLFTLLKTLSCLDCGDSRPEVLQFDHRDPSTKLFAVSRALGRGISWSKILAEIEKCDVRCANCHTMRTSKQQGWYKDLI